ncbi:MAG: DUF3307 domain-containing protein [Blastocatellia bacterium]
MVVLFFKLLIGHFLADYPLQGEFLAKAKNHKQPIPGVPWIQALIAHAAIHAGMVWFLTGSGVLGCFEFFLHLAIDGMKCEGTISFNVDQLLHWGCKALWAYTAISISI